jgi:hypothetical protein
MLHEMCLGLDGMNLIRLKLLLRFMVLDVLGDVNCLEELTTTEEEELTGFLILKS